MPLTFYLNTPEGRRKSATLPAYFKLEDFRNLIEKKVGNPEHFDYTLGDVVFRTWNEEAFDQQRTAIHDGVTLIIQYPPVGPNSPPWRQALPGLCLEGVCLNVQCDAFEQKVLANQGLGEFRAVTDSQIVATKCPLCGASVTPTICAFYQCSWRVTGVKHDESKSSSTKTTTTDWCHATNDYQRWEESLPSWSELTIETRKS